MAKWKHKLRKLNISEETAICESCGPVKIIQRSKDKWRCYEGHIQSKPIWKKPRPIHHPKPDACEICGIEKSLCWDHDHNTGKHRGWLCQNCNLGLGNFHDDLGNLKAAIEYIIKSRT